MAQDMYTNPGAQSTTSSPIGSFPELWKYSDALNAGKLSQTESSGMIGSATTAMEDKRAAAAAAKKKKAELIRIKKEDGGFDFFDGDGNPITASQYAQANDITISEALKGSENGMDTAYMNDIKLLTELDNATRSGDQDKIKKIIIDNPSAAEFTPRELIDQLKSTYKGIFKADKPFHYKDPSSYNPWAKINLDETGFTKTRQDIYNPWSN